MKQYILFIVLLCCSFEIAYSQNIDVSRVQRDTIVSGRASWTVFSSKVFLSVETKKDSIQEIFFEEDINEDNQVTGSYSLSDLKNNLYENLIVFNNAKANKLLRIYVSPNFNPADGGLLIFSLFQDEKWEIAATMHIRKEYGVWKIFYQDLSSENDTEYCIQYIEFRLTFSLNRIKKSKIKTKQGEFIIYPSFEKN